MYGVSVGLLSGDTLVDGCAKSEERDEEERARDDSSGGYKRMGELGWLRDKAKNGRCWLSGITRMARHTTSCNVGGAMTFVTRSQPSSRVHRGT